MTQILHPQTPLYGFRDRRGRSRALTRLVSAIETGLAGQSQITDDVKVNHYGVDEEGGYAWYRLEQTAPLQLSLADAQRFVIFLMHHFLCFDLTITTRLSK